MAAASVADSPRAAGTCWEERSCVERGSAQALAYGDHLIRAQKRQKTKSLREQGQEEKAGSSARAWARLPATNENDQLLSRHPTWACGTAVPLSARPPRCEVTPRVPEQELQGAEGPGHARSTGHRASRTFQVRAALHPAPPAGRKVKAGPAPPPPPRRRRCRFLMRVLDSYGDDYAPASSPSCWR